MDLSFDIRGYLKPYEKIEIEFEEFKASFVESFEVSSTRQKIFSSYLEFLSRFEEEITPNFIQWIDGSFVTNKENPKDIDFVTLIDFDIFEKNEELIESKFRLRGAKANFGGLDAYALKVYPENHERKNITEYDKVYWKNWFSETKKNRLKKKYPKGFLEIKFGNKK